MCIWNISVGQENIFLLGFYFFTKISKTIDIVHFIYVISNLLPFRIAFTDFSSSATMDLKVFISVMLCIILSFATESLSLPSDLRTRHRRSPQKERENLSHCNSSFLNFAKFKQRGCPPPKFCTLSRPLKLRYCTKGPGTGVF